MESIHGLCLVAMSTAFIMSGVTYVFVAHYVRALDWRLVIISGVLLALIVVMFVYDASDFDDGSIESWMLVFPTVLYVVFNIGIIWKSLRPQAGRDHFLA